MSAEDNADSGPTGNGPRPGYRRGVGIMLLNPAGLVFVAQRLDMKEEAWQMPQGGIEEGESPAQAAMRELAEEIGTGAAEIIAESAGWYDYDLPPKLADRLWGGRYRGQTQKWFACRFRASDDDICLDTEHPEFRAWKWAEIDSLSTLIVPFKRALYGAVIAELAPKIAANGGAAR
ncbi:MAG: RNA pyrophosphohydrolase [Alphaproteobacteria bacterium]